jgi:hypothetical protein
LQAFLLENLFLDIKKAAENIMLSAARNSVVLSYLLPH